MASPGAAGGVEEEEDDFMSDKFIAAAAAAAAAAAPLRGDAESYSARRSRKLDRAREQGRVRSRAEREADARRLGLSRSLISNGHGMMSDGNGTGGEPLAGAKRKADSDAEGGEAAQPSKPRPDERRAAPTVARVSSSPALRMMLAMGFKPGEGLGLGNRSNKSKDSTSATLADTNSGAKMATADPLALDERWLGKKRFGIGRAPQRPQPPFAAASALASDISTAIADDERLRHAHSGRRASADAEALADFRKRASQLHEARHLEGQLVQARKTCEELDRKLGMEFSPLWIHPDALSKPACELPSHVAELVEYAFAGVDHLLAAERDSAETGSTPSQGKGTTLDEAPAQRHNAGEGSTGVDTSASRTNEGAVAFPDELDDNDNGNGDHNRDRDQAAVARAAETRRFCALPALVRLEITLSHLRRAHAYCLFCGVQYAGADDLEARCPGEEEDDH